MIKLFKPTTIFVVIWVVQGIGYLSFRDTFGSYSQTTWLVVLTGVAAFCIGGLASRYISTNQCVTILKEFERRNNVEPLIKYFLALYFIAFLWVGHEIVSFSLLKIENMTLGPKPLVSQRSIRQLIYLVRVVVVNDNFSGERVILNLFRFYYFGLASSLYFSAYTKANNYKHLLTFGIIGLVSALATTGRLALLLFFLSYTLILVKKKVINFKGVTVMAALFSFAFFMIAYLMKKGDSIDKNLLEVFLWNLKVYLFSGLSSFNYFVVHNVPDYKTIVMIPNALKVLLNSIFNLDFALRPASMPFVETPLRTNVYTSFFPLYHDAKLLGVIFGKGILGFLHQMIYKIMRETDSRVIIFIFSLSLFPLVLSFFEDIYFSSPGFWLVIVSPIFIYYPFALLYIKNKK